MSRNVPIPAEGSRASPDAAVDDKEMDKALGALDAAASSLVLAIAGGRAEASGGGERGPAGRA